MKLNEALFNLVHTVRNNMAQQVKQLDLGLSPMHMKSLKLISKLDECTGQKMADFMGRDKAQINRLLKELVNQELITKKDNEKDKRSQLLALTAKGEAIMEKFKVAEQQIFNTMIDGIAPEQLDSFIDVAERLRKNLQ